MHYTAALYTTINAVLTDEGFEVNSLVANEAKEAATQLLQWGSSNPIYFNIYANQLFYAVSNVAKTTIEAKCPHTELICSVLTLISSSNYKIFWQCFTKSANTKNSVILNYFATYQMLQNTLKRFQNSTPSVSTNIEKDITADEAAAIQYIGGYIVRKTITKIQKKSLPTTTEIICLLYQLLQDPETNVDLEEEEFDTFSIDNWSRIIDRGGLLHGTKEYTLTLISFEKVVKKNITSCQQTQLPIDKMEESIKENCKNEWDKCFLYEASKEAKESLRTYIIQEYIKLRGFAHAARWMEKFKYEKNKKLSKSKSLRNKLSIQ